MKKTALILGATGLVGNLCLELLVASQLYEKIIVLSRKRITPPLFGVENIVTDFSNLHELKSSLVADDIFCAMGTTISKAGSQSNFKKIDFDIPLQTAQFCKENGASKFILVSSIGANSQSKIFYSRIKGKLEEALEKLDYNSLIILQPSFLLGEREDFRLGEAIGKQIAKTFAFVFTGKLKPYKGIDAKNVAKAMIVMANSSTQKVECLTYTAMRYAAAKFGKW